MLRALKVLAAAMVVGLWSTSAKGELITLVDVQPMIDFPDCDCPKNLPASLPFALFDFTSQPPIRSITGLELTLTIEDGDTAPGEFDFGILTLGLDDVSTGLALNGFASRSETTLTFSVQKGAPGWIGDDVAHQLLASLNADNQLLAKILDATPLDNSVNLYSVFDTTLRITGESLGPNTEPIPEPASLCIWALTLTALAGYRRRRSR